MESDQTAKYRLTDLRRELVEASGAMGVMDAYKKVGEATDKSVSEVRRWFTPEDKHTFRMPPQDKGVWDYLEGLSNNQLSRSTYYSKDFWGSDESES